MVLHLSFKDIWLDFFIDKQHLIFELYSGYELNVFNDECYNQRGQQVIKFSRSFLRKITDLQKQGYVLKNANCNFILNWYKEDNKKEYRIILPELYFQRM